MADDETNETPPEKRDLTSQAGQITESKVFNGLYYKKPRVGDMLRVQTEVGKLNHKDPQTQITALTKTLALIHCEHDGSPPNVPITVKDVADYDPDTFDDLFLEVQGITDSEKVKKLRASGKLPSTLS